MSLSEWATRKQYIDQALIQTGWTPIIRYNTCTPRNLAAFEEHPTASGQDGAPSMPTPCCTSNENSDSDLRMHRVICRHSLPSPPHLHTSTPTPHFAKSARENLHRMKEKNILAAQKPWCFCETEARQLRMESLPRQFRHSGESQYPPASTASAGCFFLLQHKSSL